MIMVSMFDIESRRNVKALACAGILIAAVMYILVPSLQIRAMSVTSDTTIYGMDDGVSSTTDDSTGSISTTDGTDDSTGNSNAKPTVNADTLTDMRGVWVAYCDYKAMGLYNKSETTFRKNADKMFAKFKKDKINTVFFHVVAFNDSIYPSKYLGWSKNMFYKGRKPKYDPLKILIEESHKYGISFHAWINPYRKKAGVVFDPGKNTSTTRIVNIVQEIIDNYDVDGIHFDDYFYPDGKKYKKVSTKKRKANVNKMVSAVYSTVKNTNENILFGISPAGSIDYAKSIGCDLDTWLKEDGYVDYIIPQIYWSDKYKLKGKKKYTKLYTQRLKQWVSLNTEGKPMMIGLALYRAGKKDSYDKNWKKKSNNIVEQIKKEKSAGCQGFVLFSSTYMYNKSGRKEMKNYRKYYGIK